MVDTLEWAEGNGKAVDLQKVVDTLELVVDASEDSGKVVGLQ